MVCLQASVVLATTSNLLRVLQTSRNLTTGRALSSIMLHIELHVYFRMSKGRLAKLFKAKAPSRLTGPVYVQMLP